MEKSLKDIDILELLPQRPPFVMVDRLLTYDNQYVETEFEVKSDTLLCDGEALLSSGLIENVAQTSAARIGYYYKYILKQPVQIGFIGAIQSFKLGRRPRVGELIRTRIDIQAEAFGITSFKGQVFDEKDEVLATCCMKTSL